jgi:hypothetical protein
MRKIVTQFLRPLRPYGNQALFILDSCIISTNFYPRHPRHILRFSASLVAICKFAQPVKCRCQQQKLHGRGRTSKLSIFHADEIYLVSSYTYMHDCCSIVLFIILDKIHSLGFFLILLICVQKFIREFAGGKLWQKSVL